MGGMGVQVSFGTTLSEKFVAFLKRFSVKLPVITLAYLAAQLKEDDLQVIDAGNQEISPQGVMDRITSFSPEYIFSSTSVSGLENEIKFFEDIKDSNDVTIGLFGEAASILSKEVLSSHNIDFIFNGEPEGLIQNLFSDGIENCDGLIYNKNGKIIKKEKILVQNLDELPFPDWSKFPVESYSYFPLIKKIPFLPILSSRGCPHGCIYCPYAVAMGAKWRFRSPENVFSEISSLVEKHGIKGMQFRDPIFSLDEKRTHEICDRLSDSGLSVEWGCETRIDALSYNTIKKMAAAGCVAVNVGIESISDGVLTVCKRKKISNDEIVEKVKLMDDYGIRVSGFFILGLPGSTRKSIQEDINFSLQLPLSYAEYKVATPFPGTMLYDIALKNKWIDDNRKNNLSSYKSVMKINDSVTPEYLEKICNKAFNSFYMNPKFILKELVDDPLSSVMFLGRKIFN